ncbi:homeobox protein 2-like [Tigriopus californicus]|uniref:homeobox protein 2-like n=1 Tax=Tigriopus californicus TaxID=6832 RepID=UPI0027DA3C0E|nr:homeobox protein 2-like [Tigriopus californicus]XP_059096603.1 homeobox protein 2-like [Tigriopus californicus]XP_059096604.1 homeobox protein 2-like [Tigriopus californicus]XP_059096605.1 homeobox protein 2-like [Tigriopus californicus]
MNDLHLSTMTDTEDSDNNSINGIDKGEERSSGSSSMELRKYRKLTAKKRILEKLKLQSSKDGKPDPLSEEPAPKVSRTDEEDMCNRETLSQTRARTDSATPLIPKKETDDIKTDENRDIVDISESNTMTLEQFTDIVLASEGLSSVKKEPKSPKPVLIEERESPNTFPMGRQSPPGGHKMKEENNNCNSNHSNNSTSTNNNNNSNHNIIINNNNNHTKHHLNGIKKTSDMVANLIQNNNDLIVEVKPMTPKPVVLSPRQPPGFSHQHQGNIHKNVLSSSVVVSVKPRIHPTPPSPSKVGLPPNKPVNISRMVEEWISKMPSPSDGHSVAKSDCALNLSTKSGITSKTTQVYLRPIPTPPKISKPNGHVAHMSTAGSPKHLSGSISGDKHRSSPSQHKAHAQYSPNQSPKLVVKPPTLSPPRLEIKKVERDNLPNSPMKKVGRASPFENNVHLDSIKTRALRDVQLAHTKDVHGNYPIHMSVLMRKPDLVRRYCCILQVLESSMDLLNEDQLTPLHLAIQDNSVEIVDILLAFGADPGVQDRRGNTSFHTAIANKSLDILKLLMKHLRSKDCLNRLNEFGITPLHIATINGDTSSAAILTKYGANPSIPDAIQGLTPLAMAKQDKLEHIIDSIPKKTTVEIPSR